MIYGYIILMAATAAIFLWQSTTARKRQVAKMWSDIRNQWAGPTECEYNYEELNRIASYYKRHKKEGHIIDDITWNDLDMDNLFLVMDRTFSFIGEEYLYYFLRTPVYDQETLSERERLFTHFTENPSQREQLQRLFYQMGKNKWHSLSESIYHFGQIENPGVLRHYIQAGVLLFSIVMLFIIPQRGILMLVFTIFYNVVTYYQKKAVVDTYVKAIVQINRLLNCSEQIVKLQDPQLRPYTEVLEKAIQQLLPLRKKSWRIQAGKNVSGNLADLLMDYVRMVTHMDLIAFYQVVGIVKEKWQAIEDLMEQTGYLEACIAVASFRQWLPYYSIPELTHQKEKSYEALNLYHPLLPSPVANTICEDRCILLTGSNASGKSTFLKIVALNTLLAQTINTSVSHQYKANFYRIYTSMSLRDDMPAGDSYYMVEIKALKRILDAMGHEIPVLCCVDEVLRGTNTVERIAASTKILERLSMENVTCFAATHDLELTNLLGERYHNYHFREEMEGDDIVFHYLLHKGPATTRNAIRLLSILGYQEEIIAEAEDMANRFLENGNWEIRKDAT